MYYACTFNITIYFLSCIDRIYSITIINIIAMTNTKIIKPSFIKKHKDKKQKSKDTRTTFVEVKL